MRNFAAAAVLALGLAAAAPAGAAVIDSAELTACAAGVSNTCVSPEGWSIVGSNDLVLKSTLGGVGLGIAGGATSDEIDIREQLAVNLGGLSILNSFSISYFFNGPEYGDLNERGRIDVTLADASVLSFFLLAGPAEEQARLFADAALSVLVATGASCGGAGNQNTGPGCFLFAGDPLGALLITAIAFTALDDGNGGSNNSDFAFSGLSYTEVPLPGAALLLLSGLAGFAFSTRRVKTARA